ncbi:MAG: hypothetical protein J7M05_13595 [Anaerolineae bacterium]|nr:hypothetical protein [Anaerolineae bacterium]
MKEEARDIHIGKIVSSSSHIHYICQIYGPSEAPHLPAPEDYGFGTFVGIEHAKDKCLVGVVYDTTLRNPEFGNLGPRLSPQEELTIFSPDYLAEKVTLVAIVLLGVLDNQGNPSQGIPTVAPPIDALVRPLSRQEIMAFHQGSQGLQLSYLAILSQLNTPLATPLMIRIITQLQELFEGERERLGVLRQSLSWKTYIEPLA